MKFICVYGYEMQTFSYLVEPCNHRSTHMYGTFALYVDRLRIRRSVLNLIWKWDYVCDINFINFDLDIGGDVNDNARLSQLVQLLE